MKRKHQERISEIYDQLQALIHEIEVEPTYLIEYSDKSKGPTIQVVKVDMSLCTALYQLDVAREHAKR